MPVVRYDMTLYLTEADAAKVPLGKVTEAIADVMLGAGLERNWATVSSEDVTDDLRPDIAEHLAGTPLNVPLFDRLYESAPMASHRHRGVAPIRLRMTRHQWTSVASAPTRPSKSASGRRSTRTARSRSRTPS